MIATTWAHWQDAYNRALAVPNCPALPKEPGEDRAYLATLLDTTETARQAEAAAQVELSRLRNSLARTTSQREGLRKIIAGHTSARETWNGELANATSLQMLDLRAAETAEAESLRHATAISPILEQVGENLAIPGLSGRLESRVAEVTQLRKVRDSNSATLVALAPQLAKAESRSENAAKQFGEANEAVTARLNTLQTLQDERAPLLGGEVTATHRTRHNEARKGAAAALDAARNALAEATAAWAAARAKAEAAATEMTGANQAQEIAQSALAEALASTDLAPADLDTLLVSRQRTSPTCVNGFVHSTIPSLRLAPLWTLGAKITPTLKLLACPKIHPRLWQRHFRCWMPPTRRALKGSGQSTGTPTRYCSADRACRAGGGNCPSSLRTGYLGGCKPRSGFSQWGQICQGRAIHHAGRVGRSRQPPSVGPQSALPSAPRG